jgi:hypothetical protein
MNYVSNALRRVVQVKEHFASVQAEHPEMSKNEAAAMAVQRAMKSLSLA